ncbi:metallophosphoesterase family protein [Nocardioides sp. GY 10127]|uniref:metallophosphoesterase family protein n=1 Tax=Nocardioides sp. GY 10127 TaxID=2569762 RepID=UPI0010A93E34|nr:metallophosphoesterase family protein [Nocardioides sp. GY 10127]TIC86448.1 metallophosphoesterase family protein [Nocardioides sp. GY 10127]
MGPSTPGAVDRVAVLSDVHGNLTALEAVLADVDARGISRVLNLGDDVGKGPRGREVIDLVRARCEVSVLGNWDDYLPSPDREATPELDFWADQLGPGQAAWLAAKPFSLDLLLSGRRLRMFHASADSVHHRVRPSSPHDEQRGLFDHTSAVASSPHTLFGPDEPPDVVVYGDLHEPFVLADQGRTVVNTGSVGNNVGDPTPVYLVLEGRLGSAQDASFSMTHVRVPYDVEAELAHARAVAMPGYEAWEQELTTGVYRRDDPSGPEVHLVGHARRPARSLQAEVR